MKILSFFLFKLITLRLIILLLYIGPQKDITGKELTLELLYDLDNPYGFRDFDWEEFKINHSLDKRTLKNKRV